MATLVRTVVPFPAPRGRPRKKPVAYNPCPKSFADVEAGCREITRAMLPAVKERVAHRADHDRLPPAEKTVLNFYLRRQNPQEGCDWHSNEHIAREKRLSVRSVERANRGLVNRGYIKRQPIPSDRELPGFRRRKHGTIPWQTTLSILADEWAAMRNEVDLPDPTEKSPRTRQKKRPDPTPKDFGTRQKMRAGPDSSVGQILKDKNLKLNTHPQPPLRGRACVKWIDEVLDQIRTPSRHTVIAVLIEPLIQNLELRAPDPIAALSRIADQLVGTEPDILTAARVALLQTRAGVVKPWDITTEVSNQTKIALGNAMRQADPRLSNGQRGLQ